MCEESNSAEWYPGDEFVDWIGMPYRDGESTAAMIQFARGYLKPVTMTLASNLSLDWNEWLEPFFQFVPDNNDVVRAVTYINNGNSLIQWNDEILKSWKDETNKNFWLRASPSLFDTLSYVK